EHAHERGLDLPHVGLGDKARHRQIAPDVVDDPAQGLSIIYPAALDKRERAKWRLTQASALFFFAHDIPTALGRSTRAKASADNHEAKVPLPLRGDESTALSTGRWRYDMGLRRTH